MFSSNGYIVPPVWKETQSRFAVGDRGAAEGPLLSRLECYLILGLGIGVGVGLGSYVLDLWKKLVKLLKKMSTRKISTKQGASP